MLSKQWSVISTNKLMQMKFKWAETSIVKRENLGGRRDSVHEKKYKVNVVYVLIII